MSSFERRNAVTIAGPRHHMDQELRDSTPRALMPTTRRRRIHLHGDPNLGRPSTRDTIDSTIPRRRLSISQIQMPSSQTVFVDFPLGYELGFPIMHTYASFRQHAKLPEQAPEPSKRLDYERMCRARESHAMTETFSLPLARRRSPGPSLLLSGCCLSRLAGSRDPALRLPGSPGRKPPGDTSHSTDGLVATDPKRHPRRTTRACALMDI